MWLGFGISDLAFDQKQLNLEIVDKWFALHHSVVFGNHDSILDL